MKGLNRKMTEMGALNILNTGIKVPEQIITGTETSYILKTG